MKHLGKTRQTALISTLLICGAQLSFNAYADSNKELLDLLLNKGIITQSEHDEVADAIKTEAKQTETPPPVEVKVETAKSDEPEVKFSNKGGLKAETTDGKYKFQVGSRIQADAAIYDEDNSTLGNGTILRRARLLFTGTVNKKWDFKSEVDFAGNDVALDDAYVRYNGLGPFNITAGNFKQPYSLDAIANTNDITFLERALPHDAFVLALRRIGAGVSTSGSNWSAAAGVFGETVSGDAGDDETDDGEGDSGISFSGRATFEPILDLEAKRVLHVGGSVQYRDRGDGEGVRLRTRPESNVTSRRLVDTGNLEFVQDITSYNLEGAGVLGPASIQGEYYYSDLSRTRGFNDANFNGWYVYGSYVITGESRATAYKVGDGIFGRIKPTNLFGAWELALRFSRVDLDSLDVEGGEEDNITFGVNWYTNDFVRFGFNYTNVIDQSRQGESDEPDLYTLRAQIAF